MKMPKHVALALDGNRRWAEEKGLNTFAGHAEGVERVKEISKRAKEMGIKGLTFWGFSTDNWKRSNKEVNYIMKDIFIKNMENYLDEFLEEETQFIHIGRKDRLPKKLIKLFDEIEEKTKEFKDRFVCFAIDHGGRDEITRAAQKAIESGISAEDLTEEKLASFLDTAGLPDPDMLIRTGGKVRTSGYLIWEIAYADMFFVDDLFPDFTADRFEEIVKQFDEEGRTLGGDRK